jgi:hypothetical protein
MNLTFQAHRTATDLRQLRIVGDWALATDGLQWIVQRRYQVAGKHAWRLLSFVRSTKAVLERCLREKGADSSSIQALTADLPETFDLWVAGRCQQHRRAGVQVRAVQA